MMFLRAVLACCALSLSGALVVGSKNDPCPFGYGTGCGGGVKLDSATKAKVAGILNGILNNLGGKKGLVQQSQSVSVSAHTESMDSKVKDTLIALSAKLALSQEDATAAKELSKMIYSKWEPYIKGKHYTWEPHPHNLDSATKDEVAKILNGIISNLSSHR